MIPPVGAQFYPYYSLATDGYGRSCTLLFGDFKGFGFDNFGGDAQYGPANLPWFFGQNSGGPRSNPCVPNPSGL